MFIFSKKQRYIKHLEDSKQILDDKKNILMSNLKRLEVIAGANDDYVQEYEEVKAIYTNLVDVENPALNSRRETLITRFNSPKLNKEIYDYSRQYEKDVNAYHKKVNQLNERFERSFAPGFASREKSIQLKNEYRGILNDFDHYQASLELCYDCLKEYLETIEIKFERLENLLDTAYYQKAEELLVVLEEDIFVINGKIAKIAEYNTLVCQVLPEKLEELQNKELQLKFDGYFISHLKVEAFAKEVIEILDGIKENFARLDFKNFEAQYDEISKNLTIVNNALDNEVSCKINFDEHHQHILREAQKVETNFINVKRQYTEAKNYYFLDEIIEQRFTKFLNAAAALSDKKRDFEGFVLSNSRNPYSFMVKKMNTIQFESQEIKSEVEFFNGYFREIKQAVEEMNAKEMELSATLMKTIGLIRKNRLEQILESFQADIDLGLKQLYQVHTQLREKPIKVSYIREQFSSVNRNISDLIRLMSQKLKEAQLAMQAILFANQLRSEFSEVEKVLYTAEQYYQNQMFKECAERVIEILKEYHPTAYNILGGC